MARPVPRLSVPVLVAGRQQCAWLSADGEVESLSPAQTRARLDTATPIVCHTYLTARRLEIQSSASFDALDILELFAFVHPARFCVPTPAGLARALDLPKPMTPEDEALALHQALQSLLQTLAAIPEPQAKSLAALAAAMDARTENISYWGWTKAVCAALGHAPDSLSRDEKNAALHAWKNLPEWEDAGPRPPGTHWPVDPMEARQRLAFLTRSGKHGAEDRPQQSDYASAVSAAFAPVHQENQTHIVLAEAGTGVGKTLGYLAPATVWAERNSAPVWISTYTRNLQNQIDGELERLYPDPAEKRRRVVVRKGRENYLCLLNLEEALRFLPSRPTMAPALGLMVRWAMHTRSGDLAGDDLPGWLPGLVGRGPTLGLSDRRGECVHSACPHYSRCFVEHTIRQAQEADIVIANHALVMAQAAVGDMSDLSQRLVFDEGHHVFDAADSAFSFHLSGAEAADLRRWIRGHENSGSSRARGLRRRIEGLVADDGAATDLLDSITQH
ncbi:MAG: ATP-dependent DNA helicase, partial [Pseudomonadota bacterium]|nr:ATP-dependent DNA helicase [Pseudomonadota bacterium]